MAVTTCPQHVYLFKVPPSVMTTAFSGRPHFARAFAARSSPRNDATAFICRALAPGENVGTCIAQVDRSLGIHQVTCVSVHAGEDHVSHLLDLSRLHLWQHSLQ